MALKAVFIILVAAVVGGAHAAAERAMSASSAALSGIQTMQVALQLVQSLGLTSWRFPPACTPSNGSSHDFIVIGAGTAGSVLANRLSANNNINVLLIEAGGPSPLEADLAGIFPILPSSVYDYDFKSVNDGYTAQNLQGGHVGLTQGKMFGGSSALNHVMHVQGHPLDYNHWAEILDDPIWTFENIQPYLRKPEKLVDDELLICPTTRRQHGTDGPIKITRELQPSNKPYLDAFEELGHEIVNDISTKESRLGYTEPIYANADGLRQSSAVTYLSEAKSRPNLCVMPHTTVDKILFEKDKAVGVLVTDSNDNNKVYLAKKEVIVSAGAFNSPKLLMLSGIGPKDHLESLDIDMVVNLPVGKNLQDHPTTCIAYQMEKNTSPTPGGNPGLFSVPMTAGYVALDPEQTYPDYQSINLLFPHESAGFLQFCSNVLKFTDSVCDTFYNASVGRNMLFTIIDLMMADSTGEVLLASADPREDPLVYTGTYSDRSDLKVMANSLKNFNKVLESSYFKSVNASFIDLGLCPATDDEDEFWECYAVATSSSLWHYVGTCAMGSVLDSRMRVKGVKDLRVIDSSALPTEVRGNPNAAILMVAERASDFILQEWGLF